MAIVLICGGECGRGSTTSGIAAGFPRHWATPVGTTSFGDTSGPVPMRSPGVLRLNPSSQTQAGFVYDYDADIASPATMVWRFGIYFASLPTADCLLNWGDATRLGLAFRASDSSLLAGQAVANALGTVGAGTNFPVVTGRWYDIDTLLTRDGGVGVRYRLSVDGTEIYDATSAGVSTSIGAGTIGTWFDWGAAQTGSADVYFDDIASATTAAEYPIGGGGLKRVRVLFPNGDGTHSYSAAGDFGKGAGGTGVLATPSSSETTSWQSLADPLPSTIQTNFIGGIANAVGEYLEWTMDDMPENAKSIDAVQFVMCFHSASATANNHRIILTDGGSNVVDLINATLNATAGTALRTTTAAARTTDAAANAWTNARVNQARLRWNPQDVNPDAFLDAVCLEVLYVPAPLGSSIVVPTYRGLSQAVHSRATLR